MAMASRFDFLASRQPAPRFGQQNLVLRAQSRHHFVKDFAGPLSIKCVREGSATWQSEGRAYRVDQNSFLVLAEGQTYTLNIDSRQPIQTCIVFFDRQLLPAIFNAPLDIEPAEDRPASLDFLFHLHLRDERVFQAIEALASSGQPDPMWLEEQLLGLAQNLLLLYREFQARARSLACRKSATRAELAKRLLRGRDYLHSHFSEAVTLIDCAREACLSPFHFQRSFVELFGQSPHAYLTTLRLADAKRLLNNTPLTITEIAQTVGFASATSFSNLFRFRFGMSPVQYRRQNISKIE